MKSKLDQLLSVEDFGQAEMQFDAQHPGNQSQMMQYLATLPKDIHPHTAGKCHGCGFMAYDRHLP
jgi:hypothetical protein